LRLLPLKRRVFLALRALFVNAMPPRLALGISITHTEITRK